MANGNKEILEQLKDIKSELDYLKQHLVNFDIILTDDDIESLQQAEKDFKNKKTLRIN